MVDLIIQDGTVVTPNGSFKAEIAVKDGKIWAIGGKGSLPEAAEKIDATGLHICRV
jgi:dihydroorotase-like cyclic amidohydrolase